MLKSEWEKYQKTLKVLQSLELLADKDILYGAQLSLELTIRSTQLTIREFRESIQPESHTNALINHYNNKYGIVHRASCKFFSNEEWFNTSRVKLRKISGSKFKCTYYNRQITISADSHWEKLFLIPDCISLGTNIKLITRCQLVEENAGASNINLYKCRVARHYLPLSPEYKYVAIHSNSETFAYSNQETGAINNLKKKMANVVARKLIDA